MNEIIKKIDEEIEMYKDRISVRQGANYHDESERIIRFEERMNEAIRIKEIIQSEQKDLMTDYHQAREIIKQYCQNEDCNEDCKEYTYPLSAIRCGEEAECKSEQTEDKDFLHWKWWRFSIDWFTDCGDWFLYFRYKRRNHEVTNCDYIVSEIRCSSIGFMKSNFYN